MKGKRTSLALLVAIVASIVRAQTVRQGEPTAPVSPTAFHSPMVIETVFPAAEPDSWRAVRSLENFKPGKPIRGSSGDWFSVPEWYALGKYSCDGLYLREESKKATWEEPGIRMKVRRLGSGPSEKTEATVEVTVYNPKENQDKLVTLQLDVLGDGDARVATGSLALEAPANARSGNNGDVRFVLSRDELNAARKLRVTVAASDSHPVATRNSVSFGERTDEHPPAKISNNPAEFRHCMELWKGNTDERILDDKLLRRLADEKRGNAVYVNTLAPGNTSLVVYRCPDHGK